MDIDPVDDGPKQAAKPHAMTTSSAPMHISEEEEARQAIEIMRGDDVSARVAAASRLEAVAKTLGEERTREVGALFSGWKSQNKPWVLRTSHTIFTACFDFLPSFCACFYRNRSFYHFLQMLSMMKMKYY
jgi:hypothetical protein